MDIQSVIPDDTASQRLLTAFLLGSKLQRIVDQAQVPSLNTEKVVSKFAELCRKISNGEATCCDSSAPYLFLAKTWGMSRGELEEAGSEQRIIERHCATELLVVLETLSGESDE